MMIRKPKVTFILLNKYIPFIFVIPPLSFNIISNQNIESINLIDFGEKVKVGEKKADRISFSTFIPSIKSRFFNLINPLPPFGAMMLLKNWKDNGDELKFLIPESLIVYKCKIENLEFSTDDLTGDMNIEVTLIEARTQNKVTDNITGLFGR